MGASEKHPEDLEDFVVHTDVTPVAIDKEGCGVGGKEPQPAPHVSSDDIFVDDVTAPHGMIPQPGEFACFCGQLVWRPMTCML